jgi:hypothetical protein
MNTPAAPQGDDSTASSESREPKYKADDTQSSRFLTGRTEATGSLGGGLIAPQGGGQAARASPASIGSTKVWSPAGA